MEYTPQKDMFNVRRRQIFSMYNNADQILRKSEEQEEEILDIEKSEEIENEFEEEVDITKSEDSDEEENDSEEQEEEEEVEKSEEDQLNEAFESLNKSISEELDI